MKKRILIPFILVMIFIAGLLGFQYLGAATYEQPLYGSYWSVPTADSTANTAQRDVVGNKTDAAATGAVSTTESLMAYVKQLVTGQITVDSLLDVPTKDAVTNLYERDVIGNKTDTAATGAVSETETLMAYGKQLVTEGIARDTAIGVIDGYFDAPTKDAATDTTIRDAIGRKTDTAAAGAVSEVESLMAYVKQLVGIAVTSGVKLPTATQASIDAIELDTGTTIPGTITTAQNDLDIITGATGANLLTATQASIDAVELAVGTTIPGTITTAQNDLDILTGATGANLLTATQASIDAVELAVGTTIPGTITTAQNDLDIITGATGVNLLTASQASIDAIEVDTSTTLPATLAIAAAAANASFSHPNYLAVATGTFDTTGTWSTVASHEIATVTGMVRMLIIPECVTTVASVSDTGTIQLGDEVATDSIIAASTLGSGSMAAGELWVDATLTRTILTKTQLNAIEIVVAGGQDIGYEVAVNALSGGSMIFHIYWTPLDTTGAVVAGEGGTL